MKKEITFNSSFRTPAQPARSLASYPVLQYAAVHNCFRLPDFRNKLSGIYQWTEEDDALIQKYSHYNRRDEKYTFKDYERRLILRSLGREGIIQTLDKLKPEYRDDLIQQMFEKYVRGTAPPLEEQNLKQLTATYTVAIWTKETGLSIPTEKRILAHIKQKELLQPFIELTSYFAGRQEELARLSDYVDWRPKSSVFGSIKSSVLEFINWNDKPPLFITGIGGVGKSTLVAKFILDQLNYKTDGKLPFIYFDFDKPGLSISNPIELVIDAFRQLSLLFPESETLFDEIRTRLVNESVEKEEKSKIEYATQSRVSDRSVIYEKYAKEYTKQLQAMKKPILVVFDSFEEIQYRASPAELNNLFSLIQEISNRIPRLRPVFVGRAEANYSDLTFQHLHLGGFDKASATAFLESRGVANEQLRNTIFSKLGGHPLTLQMAANWVEKAQINTTAEVNKLGDLLDEAVIQETLVKRNLSHTHDLEVEKIAIPGILVRRINPEIILKVLAGPCGFANMTPAQAEEIFADLRKESFLITSSGSDINFRQNLRMALYDLIMKKPEYHGKEVHDNAVNFYKDKPSPEDRAEYLYHRLMRGDDPSTIENIYTEEVRPYIEQSLTELPNDAYLYLATQMGIRASSDKVKQSALLQWEDYQKSQIIDHLKKGDEKSLKKISDELTARPERTPNSPLLYYEAKVLIRLANFKKAAPILEKALSECPEGNNIQRLNIQVLKSDLYEYQLDFRKAYETISPELLLNAVRQYHTSKNFEEVEGLINSRLAWSRLAKRLGEEYYQSTRNMLYKFIEPFQEGVYGKLRQWKDAVNLSGILPFPYKAYAERRYGHREEIDFRSLFAEMDNSFSGEGQFKNELRNLEKRITNKVKLEMELEDRYNLNLKDICEPGILKINLIDVVKYMELDHGVSLEGAESW